MDKAILLLSGGIDSPVAAHLMKNRVEIIAAHFHQEPLSDKKETDKVKQLAKKLNIKKVYLIPFLDVFKLLTEKCQHKHYFVLSKIVMFKAAELVAQKEKAKYLLTGENLAQVSSQTLSNLTSITKQINVEILRPLLTYDKQEIINKAKKIGTYDISKGPEICNLLGPKNPATKTKVDTIARELEEIDLSILQEALNKAQILTF